MNKTVMGAVLMLGGFVLLLAGGFQGGLLIIFPFIITSSPVGLLGSLILMIGVVMLFFGIASDFMGYEIENTEMKDEHVEQRGIGFIMLGPVPLIIDTKNKKLTLISLGIFITAIVILLVLIFYDKD